MTLEELMNILIEDIRNEKYEYFINILQNPEKNGTNQLQILEALTWENQDAWTILHRSAFSGNLEVFKAALGIIPEDQIANALIQKDINENTVLCDAAFSGNLEVFKAALDIIPEDQIANALMQQDESGNTILHNALDPENIRIFMAALDAIPKNQIANVLMQKNSSGHNVLHYSVYAKNLETFKAALNSIIDPGQIANALMQKNDEGYNVLNYVVIESINSEIFIEALNDIIDPEIINALMPQNSGEYNFLHYAADSENSEIFMAALNTIPKDQKMYSLINQQTGHEEVTVLHKAAYSNIEIFRAVLDNIPKDQKFNALMKADKYGNTVLHYVTRSTKIEIFMAALSVLDIVTQDQRESALMHQGEYGNTVVHWAVVQENIEIFTAVLNIISADQIQNALMQQDDDGSTVLHQVAFRIDRISEILKLVKLNLGVENFQKLILTQDIKGNTFLNLIAQKKPELVDEIIDAVFETTFDLKLIGDLLQSLPRTFSESTKKEIMERVEVKNTEFLMKIEEEAKIFLPQMFYGLEVVEERADEISKKVIKIFNNGIPLAESEFTTLVKPSERTLLAQEIELNTENYLDFCLKALSAIDLSAAFQNIFSLNEDVENQELTLSKTIEFFKNLVRLYKFKEIELPSSFMEFLSNIDAAPIESVDANQTSGLVTRNLEEVTSNQAEKRKIIDEEETQAKILKTYHNENSELQTEGVMLTGDE